MKPFDFCPSCATGLEVSEDGEGKTCPHCRRSWYPNSSPTAGCVIVANGRALVTERAKDPEKGKFDVPGGFLKAGEDVLDGLRREVKEELGVEIDVTFDDFVQAIPHEYGDEGDFVLAMGFRARMTSGQPEAADDVEALRWVSLDELDDVPFAWEHDRVLVRRGLEEA
ncbi:MAG: NUDIX domain-containing protein [Actinobacteria bacterium]|nr:NUDIX domain-containing protein [Actinomycetota bacterium]